MYLTNEIKTAFKNLVGVQAGFGKDSSESGIYANDHSAFIKTKTMEAVRPEDDTNSDWMERIYDGAVGYIINRWWSEKMAQKTAHGLIQDGQVLPYKLQGQRVENPDNTWFGVRIKTKADTTVRTFLDNFSVRALEPFEGTLSLFASDVGNPIEVDFNYTKNSGFEWLDIPEQHSALRSGVIYYLIVQYPKDSIYVNEITDDVLLWQSPRCGFVDVHYFYTDNLPKNVVQESGLTFVEHDSFGINLNLRVKCDYTDFIIRHKSYFAYALSLKLAINILEEMQANADQRVNHKALNIRFDHIGYILEGNPDMKERGLKGQLTQAINAIKFDTKGIEAICLPCNKRRGINFKHV